MSFNSSCLFVEQANEINNNDKPTKQFNTIATTESNKETKPVEVHPNDVAHLENLETFQVNAACLLVDLLLPNKTELKQEPNESNIENKDDIVNKNEQTSFQLRTNAKSFAEINTFTGFEPSGESHLNQISHIANRPADVLASRTNEEIPLYRLRTESVNTYNNTNWIKAPSKYIADQQLTNEQIKFTLDYFILSGHRISQMTKTYHDIEAVTKLLDEKEKDLELAAHIGKQLLERDQQLENKIEILEVELDRTSDMVNQLRHEIVLKDNLLKSFIEFESEAYNEEQVYRDSLTKHAYELTTTSNEQVNEYKRRIRDLENENRVLKDRDDVYELGGFISSSSFGKVDEKSSHANCLKEIESTHKNLEEVKEELDSKTNECLNQQEEIQNLFSQIFVLQLKVKDLTAENSDLQSFYDSTTSELIDQLNELKEKYNECLLILAKTQEELSVLRRKSNGAASKVNKHQQTHVPEHQQNYQQMRSISTSTSISSNMNQLLTSDPYMSFDEHDEHQQHELVNESVNSNTSTSNNSKNFYLFPNNQHRNESLASEMFQSLARDYRLNNSNLTQQAYTSSDMVRKVKLKLIKQLPGSSAIQIDPLLTDSEMETYDQSQQRNTFNTKFTSCPTPDSIFSTGSASIQSTSLHHLSSGIFSQNSASNLFMLPEKLQIVKPIEGSQTLQHWQHLARPNLACLFEERPGIAVKENLHELHDQRAQFASKTNRSKSNMEYDDNEADYDFGVNETLDSDFDETDIEMSYINDKRLESHADQSTTTQKKDNYRMFSPSKLELLNKLLENDKSPVKHDVNLVNSSSQNKFVDFFSSYFRSATTCATDEQSEKEKITEPRRKRAEYDDPDTPPSSPINIQFETSSNLFYDVLESAKVRCRMAFVDSFFSSYLNKDQLKKNAPTPPGTPFNELSDDTIEQFEHKEIEKTVSTHTNSFFEQILNKLNFFSFKPVNSESENVEHNIIKPSASYVVNPRDKFHPELEMENELSSKEDLNKEKCSTPPPSPCRLSPHLNIDLQGNDEPGCQSILEKSAFVKVATLNPFINKSIDLASLLGSLSSLKRNQRFCK